MNQSIRITENKKPVYCRECKSQGTFKRCQDRDTKTDSGKVVLEGWKCRECGHVVWGVAKWGK